MSIGLPRRITLSASEEFGKQVSALVQAQLRPVADSDAVTKIIDQVQDGGDAAVLACVREFDGIDAQSMTELTLGPADFEAAYAAQTVDVQAALTEAAARIRTFAERQRIEPFEWQDEHGSVMGQHVVPLECVGIYVPGGKAAYPSTVLMNAIPAQVAGVKNIVMATPSHHSKVVLAAAHVAGVTQGFAMGGAHAIAALALGTETVPSADKITGPGNIWVAEAKRQLHGRVGIDMIAGPSEILVITDGTCGPELVARDLMAQAEHDEQAQAWCVGFDAMHLDAVEEALRRLVPAAPRRAIIEKSFEDCGGLFLVGSIEDAIAFANMMGPEHLHLAIADPERFLPHIQNAGAVFLGANSPEVLGDYCAGPNHVLPTGCTSAFSSALGTYDFQKRITTQKMSVQGSAALAPIADCLARLEGLDAHAESARCRMATDS